MESLPPGTDLSKVPTAPPPPGVVPNFTNPVTKAQMMTVVISVMLSLMLVFVSFRVFTNLWVSKRFAKSDCEYCPYLVGEERVANVSQMRVCWLR